MSGPAPKREGGLAAPPRQQGQARLWLRRGSRAEASLLSPEPGQVKPEHSALGFRTRDRFSQPGAAFRVAAASTFPPEVCASRLEILSSVARLAVYAQTETANCWRLARASRLATVGPEGSA
ncbi:hypothetical protein P7K49_012335, partial [Saguinus oedipus]